ncbi:MAG: hypothetical protein A2Z17_04320 [Gammaproteobacteria bacterium RBG_16_66_13]|nr:MAG: hypothetical protein A2Z17_04320 [Gammaproteobacteria bacterium RBG_16_66_13]
MTPADVRLDWYAEALDEIGAFLLSGEIVWPMEHPPARLRQDLSLGGLLLTQDSLRAELDLSAAAQRRLEEIERRWKALRRSQASTLSRKAEKELDMRVNLWRAYLNDLADRGGFGEEYPFQVRQRVMMERLGELGAPLRSRDLSGLDERLRKVFRPGAFVWEPALEGAYPKTRYWFLYGTPEAEG